METTKEIIIDSSTGLCYEVTKNFVPVTFDILELQNGFTGVVNLTEDYYRLYHATKRKTETYDMLIKKTIPIITNWELIEPGIFVYNTKDNVETYRNTKPISFALPENFYLVYIATKGVSSKNNWMLLFEVMSDGVKIYLPPVGNVYTSGNMCLGVEFIFNENKNMAKHMFEISEHSVYNLDLTDGKEKFIQDFVRLDLDEKPVGFLNMAEAYRVSPNLPVWLLDKTKDVLKDYRDGN